MAGTTTGLGGTSPSTTAQGKASRALSSLDLFHEYDRASFENAFGIQPPPFQPDQPTKTWEDESAKDGEPYHYGFYDPRTGERETIQIDGSLARRVNLPGVYRYQSYSDWLADLQEVEPTAAYQEQGSAGKIPLSPQVLMTIEEARDLMNDIGGDRVIAQTWERFPIIYPSGEDRRIYTIVKGEETFSAWGLRAMKYDAGVGAPGHWETVDGVLRWTPDPKASRPEGVSKEHIPVPQRQLGPTESLRRAWGGLLVVVDSQAVEDPGAFTEDDRATLAAILAALRELAVKE